MIVKFLSYLLILNLIKINPYQKVEHIYTLPGILNIILQQVPNLTQILVQISTDLFIEFPHSIISNMSAISTLSILGNCLELFHLTVDDMESVRLKVTVIISLLQRIELNTGVAKSSNMSWHPVRGRNLFSFIKYI